VSSFIDLRNVVTVADGYPLLSGLSLRIEEQTTMMLVGGNGAGKTSLLRLLAGLDPLAQGAGEVAGITLGPGSSRLLRRNVGWLGHEGSFYEDLTVSENLQFATKALGLPLETMHRAVEMVGLTDRMAVRTKRLSAGQRRRFGLAWLLIRRPALWLLDEPFATVDDAGRQLIERVLGEAVGAGATVIFSAHETRPSISIDAEVVIAGGRVVG
jgi:heme exporter protein A